MSDTQQAEVPEDQQCSVEGCKARHYLRHAYCSQHWQKEEIEERWQRWINANEAFGLAHLPVHPMDWIEMGLPVEWQGFPVRPFGVDVCTCEGCEKARQKRKAAMEGVR